MTKKQITWIEISRRAIEHNVQQFRSVVKKSTVLMAVVKSNAYGHGLLATAHTVKRAGVPWLATVNLDEALELRSNGIRGRLLVLSYFNPEKLVQAVKQHITLTVYSYKAARILNGIAKRQHKKIKIHFKVDTGTSRLGIAPKKCITHIQKISLLKYVQLEGIFSHFADAENPNQRVTKKQIKQFNSLIAVLDKMGIDIPIKHLACSAATILNKQSHLDLVRIGISLYGLWSIEQDGLIVKKLHRNFNLKPALSWRTKIVQVKAVEKGAAVGYGRTYYTKKKMKLAVLPVGYWEGYDRKLSNTGEVLIRGKRCPIRGRICMNLTMVDVTHIRTVRAGDTATLIGKDGNNSVTADELAEKIGTINYEIVTRINPQLPRIIVN